MATNYQRGANFERWMVKWLRARGWVAARTAGSHGSFDVIALRNSVVLLMQLKKGCKVSTAEREALSRDAEMAGAYAILVAWKRGGFDAAFVESQLAVQSSFFEPSV